MVCYYGRAKQRTGSVNTNQPGLKMSGCPSKVGRKGSISRYIAQRVKCNIQVVGCGKKQYRCRYGVNGDTASKEALACACKGPYIIKNGNNVVKRQLRTAWVSGGVGRITGVNRFSCKCSNNGSNKTFKTLWYC
jgi:hypothetical protein